MLSRACGLRHAARAARPSPAKPSATFQCSRPTSRHISLLPWRRKPTAPASTAAGLPVYFPRKHPSPWLRPWRQPVRGFLLRKIGRFTIATLIFYACYEGFMTLVFDPILAWGEADWESLSEKEKQEIIEAEEEDPPMLFLPFPFMTKAVPQPPYKASDPEWLAFVDINRDKKAQEAIRRELTDTVRIGVEKHPLFSKLLGSKGIKVSKRWLEIIYPRTPPPKHYISGLCIDDEGIFWADRPIDSLAVKHLESVIRPTAVAVTAWTWASLVISSMVSDVGSALGFSGEASQPPTWHSTVQGPLFGDMVGGKPQSGPHSGFPGNHPGGGDARTPFGLPSQQETVDHSDLTALEKRMHEHAQFATQGALLTFAKSWKPIKRPPTRGCIRVDGLVELKGEKAFMAVWVLGWYDTKQKKFVGIETKLKHLIQHRQKPAAG